MIMTSPIDRGSGIIVNDSSNLNPNKVIQVDTVGTPVCKLSTWPQNLRKVTETRLAFAASSESSPPMPMTSPPPGSLTMSGDASRSRAASRLAIFFSV